eukprot:2738583-Pleurochrysis_carterae.AAC.1
MCVRACAYMRGLSACARVCACGGSSSSRRGRAGARVRTGCPHMCARARPHAKPVVASSRPRARRRKSVPTWAGGRVRPHKLFAHVRARVLPYVGQRSLPLLLSGMSTA